MSLVPGRECGGCTACCEQLTIDTAEFQKLPGVLCQHCSRGVGCQIYEKRPSFCRTWHCGWRRLDIFDESWRPDKIGVLVSVADEGIPPGYKDFGLTFEIIGKRGVLFTQPFADMIIKLIRQRVPVFLSIGDKPGFTSSKILLNNCLETAVAKENYVLIGAELRRALGACTRHPKQRVVLKHAPNAVVPDSSASAGRTGLMAVLSRTLLRGWRS